MRIVVLALAMLAAPVCAFAQDYQAEMSRAESELRDSMAPAGVSVERVAPDEIRLRMPSDITFDFNRAEVKWEFIPRVHDLARTLQRNQFMYVSIVGHADAIGSDSYNQMLSERRAQSVGSALLQDGVAFQRISVSGRGEWDPIASNENEWGRARNRRVEISLTTTKK